MTRGTIKTPRLKGRVLVWAILLSPALLAAQPFDPFQPAPEPPVAAPSPEFRAFAMAGGGSFLGVGVTEVGSERAKALKLKDEYGVEVTRVEDDSPAMKAGLKNGDVVLEYNGQRVEGTEQFVRMVRETPSGRTVKLLVNRNGATQTIAATLAARKAPKWVGDMDNFRFDMPGMAAMATPDIPRPMISWSSSMLGVEAMPVDGQLAAYFGVKEGVLVRSVIKNTAAEKAGIRAGDVIVKVDDTHVTAPREISSAIRAAKAKKTFPVVVMRDRKESTISVTLDQQEDSEKTAPRPNAHQIKNRQ
jgi:serine protease Do